VFLRISYVTDGNNKSHCCLLIVCHCPNSVVLSVYCWICCGWSTMVPLRISVVFVVWPRRTLLVDISVHRGFSFSKLNFLNISNQKTAVKKWVGGRFVKILVLFHASSSLCSTWHMENHSIDSVARIKKGYQVNMFSWSERGISLDEGSKCFRCGLWP